MGKLKKSMKEATRLLGKVVTFPERKTNSASQASAALFSAAKSGNADSILNLSDAVRSQWRFLAFELAAGPGSSPMCMGPALCAHMNVEVQSQESLLTSESVLEHILNATTNKGKTVLSEAATNGHAHVVELLLQLGSNPQIADRLGGRTPLHYACFFGKSAAISALLDNLPDRYQRNPSSSGRNPGISGRYVETRTLSGFTALHYCCAGGNVEALHTLLQYEPNIYAASEHASWEYKLAFSRGSTPLHILAAGALLPAHCMALVSELLRYYAEHSDHQDPRSMRDSKGMVPWQVAAATPAPRCAQALSVREQLLRLLHPSTNLHQFFDPSTLVQRRNCVATLASLAASALREALLQQIQEQQQLLEHMRFNDVYKSDPDACSSRASHPVRCNELAFVKEIGDSAHRESTNGNEDNDHNDHGHDHDVCSRSNSSSSSWSSDRWSSNSGSTMASSRLPSYVCTPRNVLLQQQQLTPSQLQQHQLSALGIQLQRLPHGAGATMGSGQPSHAETLSMQGDSVQGNSVVGHSEAASTVCELCMEDEVSRLFITSCQHKVCPNCAVSLVQHLSTAPVGCPYCRIPIGGFAAISSGPAVNSFSYLPIPWDQPLQPSSDAPGTEAGAPAARMPPNFSTKSMPAAALRARAFSSTSLPSAVGARDNSTYSNVSLPPPPSQSSFSVTTHAKASAPHMQISCSEQLPPKQGRADLDADLGDGPRLRKYSDMSLQRAQQTGSEHGSGHVRKMSTMSLPAKKNKPDTKAAASSRLRKDSTKSLPQRRDKEAKVDLVPSFLSMASPPMQANDIQVKASHKRNNSTKSLPPLLDNPDSEAASAVLQPNFASMSLPQMSKHAPFRTQTIGVA